MHYVYDTSRIRHALEAEPPQQIQKRDLAHHQRESEWASADDDGGARRASLQAKGSLQNIPGLYISSLNLYPSSLVLFCFHIFTIAFDIARA